MFVLFHVYFGFSVKIYFCYADVDKLFGEKYNCYAICTVHSRSKSNQSNEKCFGFDILTWTELKLGTLTQAMYCVNQRIINLFQHFRFVVMQICLA